jgi:hypothetical protein
MIAVALAVIAGVVAVTCGVVADSNHADTLTFLGLMVKTTAAQIFLAGAICTWALFAAVWLLSVGVRRSRQRGLELRALRALRADLRIGDGDGDGIGDGDELSATAAADLAAPSKVRARAMLAETEPTLTDDAFAFGEAAPLDHPDTDWHPWR